MQDNFPSDLLVQEFFHGVFAIPFALFIWKKTKSLRLLCIVILLTYAMDFDHLVDYFRYYGLKFDVTDFISAKYFQFTGKAMVPLHAWEWLLILAFFIKKKGWKSVYGVLFASMAPHLIFDSITVGSILFYSFLYRVISGLAF